MRNFCWLTIVAALTACSSAPVEIHYYLLRGNVPSESRQLEPLGNYALGTVELAPYINQRGLLLQTADNQIRPARQHLWAEPLPESVRLFLAQEISHATDRDLLPLAADSSVTSINVSINQFHGTNTGGAVLVAYWWFSQNGQVGSRFRFAENVTLTSDGYSSLARAQETLLIDLAEHIAQELDLGD